MNIRFYTKRLFFFMIGLLTILTLIFILRTMINRRQSFIIKRAIVASDTNPLYLDFWPIVAKAWKRLGVKPVLALIAEDDVQVDETVGDVLRFKPIVGIPNGLYAQAIRLLLPAYFEDEICILSDIDMIPISKSYFIDSVKHFPEDSFVVYRDTAYKGTEYENQYPICYNAAKGSTFKEVFNIHSVRAIPFIIRQWASQKLGWCTDEILLYQYLQHWNDSKNRCIKLGSSDRVCQPGTRIDRIAWQYDIDLLVNKDHYVDCHSLRPYKLYKQEVDKLAMLLGLL